MLCKMRYHGFSHAAYRAHFHLLDGNAFGLDYLLSLSGKNCILEGLLWRLLRWLLLKLHMHVQKNESKVMHGAWRGLLMRSREGSGLCLLRPPLLLRLCCCGLLSWPFCMVKVEFAIMAFSFSLLLLLLLLSQLLCCWVERLRLHSLAVLARPKFCFSGPFLGSSAIRFSANTRSEIFPCKN